MKNAYILLTFLLINVTSGFECEFQHTCNCRRVRSYTGALLRILDCQDKKLTTVPSFKNVLYPIEELILDKNCITNIPERAFENLTVKKISLRYNRLEKVDYNAFEGTSGLVTINLDHCRLRAFKINFTAVPNLRTLTLNMNSIHVIEAGTFKGANLLNLELGYNQLTLFNDTFDGLQNSLAEISLAGLNLTELPHPLRKLQNLTSINFSHNKLTFLASKTFYGFPISKKKHASYTFANNGIKKILPNTFNQHTMPLFLDLNHNKITDLDFIKNACHFKMTDIIIQANELNCDCNLYYRVIKPDIDGLNIEGRCSSPYDYKGMLLNRIYTGGSRSAYSVPFALYASKRCKDPRPNEAYDCGCRKWRDRIDILHYPDLCDKKKPRKNIGQYFTDNKVSAADALCLNKVVLLNVMSFSMLITSLIH